MLDLKFIRDNPETVRKTLLNKGVEADLEGYYRSTNDDESC